MVVGDAAAIGGKPVGGGGPKPVVGSGTGTLGEAVAGSGVEPGEPVLPLPADATGGGGALSIRRKRESRSTYKSR